MSDDKKTSLREAKKRASQLREEINYHRYFYHVLDKQKISDAALDSLKKELADLEGEWPELIVPTSPTQRVGGKPLSKFRQVRHQVPMLSLQDAFNQADLRQWEKRNNRLVKGKYEYFITSKIDGVAVALIYQAGNLTMALTRGDGRVGEDVTHNIKTIESVPLRLNKPAAGEVEIRGEVYLLKDDFERLNRERKKRGQTIFANPRNVAAGSIRQLDPKVAASRPLRFFAWEITRGVKVKTRQVEYKRLRELGLAVPPGGKLAKNLGQAWAYLVKLEPKRNKARFLVDGAVLKINSLAAAERLGTVGKTPRGAIAFKYAAEEATTRVEDIVVQVGRTGALTPVAVLRPVRIAGTMVSRATLHNAAEIKRKDVRRGDTVIVRKAGDVIPEVVRGLKKLRPATTKPFHFPDHCPFCGREVKQDQGGVVTRCVNVGCFPRQRERIIYALGRSGFDVEGLGDKIIEQLMQAGLIKDAPDIWQLTAGDLTPLARFANKKATNIIRELETKKIIPLWRFLVALGVPGVGVVTAQDLAREFGTLSKIRLATKARLREIDGIGEVVAGDIEKFLAREETSRLIDKYQQAGIVVQADNTAGPWRGKIFVFTGSMENMTREEAKQKVMALGGKTASAVGRKVDYLVAGEKVGSKVKKAREIGVTILTPARFMKMIESR